MGHMQGGHEHDSRVNRLGVRAIVGAACQCAGDWLVSVANEGRAEVSGAVSSGLRGRRGGGDGQRKGLGMALKVEDGLGKEGMQVMQGHVTR